MFVIKNVKLNQNQIKKSFPVYAGTTGEDRQFGESLHLNW